MSAGNEIILDILSGKLYPGYISIPRRNNIKPAISQIESASRNGLFLDLTASNARFLSFLISPEYYGSLGPLKIIKLLPLGPCLSKTR